MSGLVFDERIAAQLEAFYRTRDVLRRRSLALGALDARPGEDVLDLGCGPGFYVEDLLERVGSEGTVTGVDPAPAMRAMTERRAGGRARVLDGGADALPLPEASVDRALTVQVLEYVPDTAGALAELRRVLRPGGRLVVWDIDWGTLSWHSEHPGRMARMATAWDRHLAHPSLPRELAPALRRAGFEDVHAEAHVFWGASMDPETFAGNVPNIVGAYLLTLSDLDREEVAAWRTELDELEACGAYFFCIEQFCFSATRPRP